MIDLNDLLKGCNFNSYGDSNYALFQGDCLEVMDYLIEQGIKIDAIITDPPYGTTRNKWDSVIPLDEMWNRLDKLVKPNGAIVLFAQTPFDKVLGASNLKMLRYEWIWNKKLGTGHLNAKKMPMKQHENILVFYKNLPTYNPQMREGKPYHKTPSTTSSNYGKQIAMGGTSNGERYPISILDFSNANRKDRSHPTQKPVDLLEYLIKTYTNEGDLVLDFTMGSGSTGVACMNLNRKFMGIELDKKYFDIAKNRIENN